MNQDSDPIIWRNCNIGAPDAETDKDLLGACFVENGCLDQIVDRRSAASIIIGRTGAGKSATLIRLEQTENVVRIDPIDLSFKYVENSTVIGFFRDNGVNLDVFYRMLWRHVLITELLRHRYEWDSEEAVSNWFENVLQRLKRDPGKAKALRYLQQWGDKFWQDTEVRVQEITEKVESELKASLSVPEVLSFSAADKLTDEERREVHSRGASVVNRIQIKELSKILDFISEEVFDDAQNRVFVTIDGLDENWVSTASKFHLIRALMEGIRTFRKVENVKIVAVVRQDLLEKVYNETRDGGFQEEKYEAYYAILRWRERDLEKLVDSRINEVYKRKYTGRAVSAGDVLPKDRGGDRAFQYLLDRTFLRPRDVILFVNECLAASEGKPRMTWAAVYNAEERYSQKRFRSLLDEWTQLYPSLKHLLDLLRGVGASFHLQNVSDAQLDAVLLRVATDAGSDGVAKVAARFLAPNTNVSRNEFLCTSLAVLYHVGVVGVKVSATSPFEWAYRDDRSFSGSDFSGSTIFRIHKMFWREFGINSNIDAYGDR